MTILSGKEFNKRYPETCYKFLAEDLTHYGFTYKLGLNVDIHNFNPASPGGLHFFNGPKWSIEFYNFGPKLGVITIPDDSIVYVQGKTFKSDRLVLSEIKTSEKDIIDLLEKSNDKNNFYICTHAAFNGHLEILKWARANGCHWDNLAYYYAAKNVHLELLKWAGDNGCPVDSRTCSDAALDGNLEVLMLAREHGCPWDKSTCSNAAFNGDLEVLKWARANGCPWDESTCECAAMNGHLDVLKWARENGCPWDRWTYYAAAISNGHLNVLKWARENGCPRDGFLFI